jgi:ectoine hydroxylase-related dioxygenase (phytanoyl-CoA dioxygenase family)
MMPAPPAPEFRVANGYLDDNVALNRILADEGYLFFRNVLDLGAVATARAEMMNVLRRLGLIESGVELPIATSIVNASALQAGTGRLDEECKKLRIFQKFVDVPANRAFFEKVVGGPVGFAPIVFYRSRPPGWAAGRWWHQDGFYNQGFDLCTAWIPVMDIDPELGGMCIAPGLEKAGFLQDLESWDQSIPEHRIPREMWRRADYHPGDVVIFKEMMPHTGLPNSTQGLYRLSFDFRFYPANRRAFLEGELAEVGDGWIVIDCDDGVRRRLVITPDSMLWSGREDLQKGTELSSWAKPLEGRVMAKCDGDRGIYVRLFKDRFP